MLLLRSTYISNEKPEQIEWLKADIAKDFEYLQDLLPS